MLACIFGISLNVIKKVSKWFTTIPPELLQEQPVEVR
jgi:hypothetical protein